MWKLLVTLALFALERSQANICPAITNNKFDDASRAQMVELHNEKRALIAQGKATYGTEGGKVGPAKNMYQMEWDCELEKHAQDWADRCQFQHSSWYGENLWMNWNPRGAGSVAKNAPGCYNAWYNEELKLTAARFPNSKFTMDVFQVAGHWSQVVWGKTNKVGCGAALCAEGTKMLIVCNYRQPGNMMGAMIFEEGNGCTKDSDCTTYPNSKCDAKQKLCMA